MAYNVTAQQLTALDVEWRTERPHVVILGAGASLAAFPDGDANGRHLPLMANLAELVGLTDLLRCAGLDPEENFEGLYSNLHKTNPDSPLLREMERRIVDYFESMALPSHSTLYDLLLLSLRAKDAIFTFNWDPFLADAVERNRSELLPHIFHLHGGVRVAFCKNCGLAVPKTEACSECEQPLIPSRLLYPVESKNYAEDEFISTQWQALRQFVKRAMLVTIFGYSAPTTDKEAMSIIEGVWGPDDDSRLVERVEIIDIRDHEELASQWRPLAHFRDHINFRRSFFDSWVSLCPRRSCEALLHVGINGDWVERISWAGNSPEAFCRSFEEIYESLRELMIAENRLLT